MHVSKKIEENDTFCIIGNSTRETFTYDNMPSCTIILQLWCSWIVETLCDSIGDVLIKFQTDVAFCTYYKREKMNVNFLAKMKGNFEFFVLTSYGKFLMFLWHITKSDLMSWHWVDLDSWIVRVLFTAVSHILFFLILNYKLEKIKFTKIKKI